VHTPFRRMLTSLARAAGRWGPPSAVLAAGLVAAIPAHAGSGPWVIGDGEYSVYVGAEAQRLERLQVVVGDDRLTLTQDDGMPILSTLGAKAILTVGVQGRFEAEITVPYLRVQANRQTPVCAALGLSACATTQGVGVITARGKGTVLDELYGDPVTWAIGADLRLGQLTAGDRQRITNLGEGTLDVGLVTSVGRGGLIGRKGGYWSGYLEAAAWYRAPNNRNYVGADGTSVAVPAPEGSAVARLLLGWRPWFSFGPDVVFYARPGGLDYGQLDLGDVDRFAALRFNNLRVGGTVIIRARENISFSASALHTVAATNNPYVTYVSLGVSTNGRLDKEPR